MKDKLYITFHPTYVPPPQGYQPETEAYMTALGVTDDATVYFTGTAQETTGTLLWGYVDDFVVGLKNLFSLTLNVQSLDNKFGFIYPFIGDSATMCKYNLANAAAFAGTFNGGFTIDSSGITGNGSNAYFNTTASQSTMSAVSAADESYGFWSKTNSAGTYCDLSSIDNTAGAQHEVYMIPRSAGNTFVTRLGSNGVNNTTANSDSSGFFSMSRIVNTEYKVYRNGSALTTHAQASNTGNNVDPVYIWALDNDSVASQFSPHKITFAYASGGISVADMASLYTLISDFQTTLNR